MAKQILIPTDIVFIGQSIASIPQVRDFNETADVTFFAHLNLWDPEREDYLLRCNETKIIDYLGLIVFRARQILVAGNSVTDQAKLPSTADWTVFQKLTESLEIDGWIFDGDRVVASGRLELDRIRKLIPRQYLGKVDDDLKLIASTVDAVPTQAIGASKNILETVSKSVLYELGVESQYKDPNVQQLVSEAYKALDIRFPDHPDDEKASNAVRQIVAGFSQIAGVSRHFEMSMADSTVVLKREWQLQLSPVSR